MITGSCFILRIFFCCLLADGQKQEVSLGGGASRQCFYDLTPSSQYQSSVQTHMQEMEGPPVSITDMTRMLQTFYTLFILYICMIVFSSMLLHSGPFSQVELLWIASHLFQLINIFRWSSFIWISFLLIILQSVFMCLFLHLLHLFNLFNCLF